jgi:hypothetical protein
MWTPIVGRSFTAAEFTTYCKDLVLGAWRPQFIVVHNTYIPNKTQWHAPPGPAQRIKNLETFYRDTQKWSAGPHLFVADDCIWVFTPLTHPGVHSPSWNKVSWGVETVGDFETEAFDANTEENLICALAALHKRGNLDPGTIRFHKEDPLTTHNCPGKNMVKGEIIARVRAALAEVPLVA